MLRIHASYQRSFSEIFLPDPFQSNDELKKVFDFLEPIFPDLMQPLVDKYLTERKKDNIDIMNGRPTIALECVLRLILLKFLHKNCVYEDVEKRASTDLAWRAFAKINIGEKVPEHTTLIKWAGFFGEEPFREIHERIILHLQGKKLLAGKRVKFDTTARESNTHYPTDARLLGDAVRVITRTVQKIKTVVKEKIVFRSPMKQVKKHLNHIGHFCRQKTKESKAMIRKETEKLNEIADRVAAQAKTISEAAAEMPRELKISLNVQVNLAVQIIQQTTLVLGGAKTIPNRIVSFFQPTMRAIVRGKAGKLVEFGKKLFVGTGERNFITDYLTLTGNPSDTALLEEGIKRHAYLLGSPSDVATDRGFSDPEQEPRIQKEYGIKRLSIPRKGRLKGYRKRTERSAWFQELQNERASQEGIIGVLKKCYGLSRSACITETGFHAEVPCGIIAYNLRTAVRILPP